MYCIKSVICRQRTRIFISYADENARFYALQIIAQLYCYTKCSIEPLSPPEQAYLGQKYAFEYNTLQHANELFYLQKMFPATEL